MRALRLDALTCGTLQPIDLVVSARQCLALHGRSGSGKTLLLRAIADLDKNTGDVWLDGVARSATPAPLWRRKVMYFPAESHWWANTVGPHTAHWDLKMLDALGLPGVVLDWEIARLSSGERQRLALARGLSLTPQALLLDEPTANLDTETTRYVETVIRDYVDNHQVPVIWVSHDARQRARIGNLVGELRAGRLQLANTPWT